MHENVVSGFSSASANVVAIVPAGTHQLPDPADHVLALTLFQQQYDANGRVPVLLQDTELKHEDVHTMEARGILATSVDGLGNVSVSIRSGGVDWTTVQLIGNPKALSASHSGIDKPLKQQKVEVLVALHKLGWRHVDDIDESWKTGSGLHYILTLSRPLGYFCALLDQAAIMAKGVQIVHHRQCDGYYKCLLLVDGPRLFEILDRVRDDAVSNQLFDESSKARRSCRR